MLKKTDFLPAQPRRAKTRRSAGQGRSERRGEEVHTALRVGRSPLQCVLANGKAPTVLPTSEELLFNVEPLNDARTPLADFFSILLRSRRELLRQQRHVFLLKGKMDDQEDDPHTDRRVGHIEGRPMVGAHIDIEKIDHLAIP